jgi:CheY-like chemotaxis protein
MTKSNALGADPDRPRRVVIVDDDAALTTLLSELFQAEGWETSTAHDARQAIQVLTEEIARGVTPDLIVLDMHMAGGDGWEFRAQLDQLRINVPIVVATGDPDPHRCAVEIDAAGYLAKPFNLGDLDQLLERLVLTGTRISRTTPAT